MAIGLAAAVIALMCLLLLLAAAYLGRALAHLVDGIPLVGGHLGNALRSAGDAIASWASSAWDSVVAPLALVITYPISTVQGIVSDIRAAIATSIEAERWIVNQYSPTAIAHSIDAVAASVATVNDRISRAEDILHNQMAGDLAAAEHYADTAVHAVNDRISNAEDILHGQIAAAAATAEHYADAVIGTVNDRISGAENILHGQMAADLAAAEHYADAIGHTAAAALAGTAADLAGKITTAEHTAVSTALGAIATDIEHGAATAAAAVDGAVAGAIDAAAGDFTDIVAGLRSIDWADVTDAAGAVAATGAIAATLGRYLEQCGMPNCRNLSQLGRDLHTLLGVVEGAGLLGALVELVTDPHGSADFLTGTVEPVVTSTAHGALSLLGVG